MKVLIAIFFVFATIFQAQAAPERRPVSLIVTGQVVSFDDKEAVLKYKDKGLLMVDRKLIIGKKLVKDKEIKVKMSFADLKKGLERGRALQH